jgi:hypothetical protein
MSYKHDSFGHTAPQNYSEANVPNVLLSTSSMKSSGKKCGIT